MNPAGPPKVLIKKFGPEGFTESDASSGVVVLGATGSGKTTGPGQLLARAYLSAGFGGLVLCAKPSEAAQWRKLGNETGRIDDFRFVDVSGNERFNFMEWAANQGGEGAGYTINIVNLLDEIASVIEEGGAANSNNGDSAFFRQALSNLLMNAVDACSLSGLRCELPILRALVTSAPQSLAQRDDPRWQEESVCWRALREAETATKDNPSRRPDYEECRNYWERDFPALSDRTRGVITLMFSLVARPFVTSPLLKLFGMDSTLKPEDTFDGRVIVIDLPVQEYALAGRVSALAWKRCFQKAVMRRRQDSAPQRNVFLYADEAQWFVTERDAEYQAVARSAGGCTVYLTQQRESLRRMLRNDDAVENLLANLQTKIFCQNTGATNTWASELLGERFVKVTSTSVGRSGLHGVRGIADDVNASAGIQRSEERRYYVEPAAFTTLKRGGPANDFQVEAVVFCGGKRFIDAENGEALPHILLTFRQQIRGAS
jgi:hypothetical protein